ncbi:RNA polymerase sigma factor [Pedobacter sp. L105]|uniref:RNA polymerase sigma factor n=1 Tax=Pedobacter sp. L105 TaxID=1641871 RepID=UPI00131D28EB|nr:RNA polymerase sigma-70 factor [Pedobacter sp. L105]
MNNKFIDGSSIKELIAGNESAFTTIYDLYSEKVYRIAFRFLKDRAQSEEIVQETFISLWLSREKLDADGNIWLYLFVIAKRLSLNTLRQICKSTDLAEKLFHSVAEGHNNTEEEIFVRDLEQYAERIIEKLPRQQKLVFKLSRVDGLSYKEIAEQHNISPNTVKNHMVEALKTLRSHLNAVDFVYLSLLFFRR